ncbi:MAG: peptide deformylase [Nitrolancea sp.]
MAALTVITEGDTRLRQKAIKIRRVDDEIRRLIKDMHETMKVEKGVGLAGNQVGVLRRVVVIGIPEGLEHEGDPEMKLSLVNPEIVRSNGRQVGTEACLSIPEWYGDVPRAMNVTVKARDENDREVRIKATGYLSRILQHEIDHLDGILFLDRVEDRSTLRHISDEEFEELAGEAEEEAANEDEVLVGGAGDA